MKKLEESRLARTLALPDIFGRARLMPSLLCARREFLIFGLYS
jgi:hypothetical protein